MSNKDLSEIYERACMEHLYDGGYKAFMWKETPVIYLEESGYINDSNRARISKYLSTNGKNSYADFGLDGLAYKEENGERIFYGIQCKYRDTTIKSSDLGTFYDGVDALKTKNARNKGILMTKQDKLELHVGERVKRGDIEHIVFNPNLQDFMETKKEKDELDYFSEEKPDFEYDFTKGLQVMSIPWHTGASFIINDYINQSSDKVIIVVDEYLERLAELREKLTFSRKSLIINGESKGTRDEKEIQEFLTSESGVLIFTTMKSLELCIDYADCVIINDSRFIERNEGLKEKLKEKSGLIITKTPDNFVQWAILNGISYIDRHEPISESIASKKSAPVFIFNVSKTNNGKDKIKSVEAEDTTGETHAGLEMDDTKYEKTIYDAGVRNNNKVNALLQGVLDTKCRKCICFIHSQKDRELVSKTLKKLALQINVKIWTGVISGKNTKKQKNNLISEFRKEECEFGFLLISSGKNLRSIPEADGVFIIGTNKTYGRDREEAELDIYRKIQVSSVISNNPLKLNKLFVYWDFPSDPEKFVDVVKSACIQSDFIIRENKSCEKRTKKEEDDDKEERKKNAIEADELRKAFEADQIKKALEEFEYEDCITVLKCIIDGKKSFSNIHKIIKETDDLHNFYEKYGRYPEYKKGETPEFNKIKRIKDYYKYKLLSKEEIAICEKLPRWEWLEDTNKWLNEINQAKQAIKMLCYVDYSFEALATDERRKKEVQEIVYAEFEMVAKNWEKLCSICCGYKNHKCRFDYQYQKLSNFHDLVFDEINPSFEKVVLLKTDNFISHQIYKLYLQAGYTNYKNPGCNSQKIKDFNSAEQKIIKKFLKVVRVELKNKVKDDLEKLKILLLDDNYEKKMYSDIECMLEKEIKKNPSGEIYKLHKDFLQREEENKKIQRENLKLAKIKSAKKQKDLGELKNLLRQDLYLENQCENIDSVLMKQLRKNSFGEISNLYDDFLLREKNKLQIDNIKYNDYNLKKFQLLVLSNQHVDISNDTDFKNWYNQYQNNELVLTDYQMKKIELLRRISKSKSISSKLFLTTLP